MRAIPIFLVSSALMASAAAAGAPPAAGSAAADKLRTALHAMMSAAEGVPPGRLDRSADRGRGDENASLRAIQVVCGHDNPSATHSAICPVPVSPF